MKFTNLLPVLLLPIALGFAMVSCGNNEIDPELIIPDRSEVDLRKPAQPLPDEEYHPLYPQVRERGPGVDGTPPLAGLPPVLDGILNLPEGTDIAAELPAVVESILGNPENTEAIQGVIASAMENAPAIIEGLQGIMAEAEGGGDGTLESYAPEILGSILKGENGEISPEAVEELSGVISEYAPAILDSIMDQASDGENSTAGAIGKFLFRKMMESQAGN